jgi:hypothetical protein
MRDMSFMMLSKSYKGLWIVEVDPKSLEASPRVLISLGMSVTYMVEYSSESSDDKEADMCVAEWNWGPKSKSFVCSSLKPNSKS